jgi:hypothetical protein
VVGWSCTRGREQHGLVYAGFAAAHSRNPGQFRKVTSASLAVILVGAFWSKATGAYLLHDFAAAQAAWPASMQGEFSTGFSTETVDSFRAG